MHTFVGDFVNVLLYILGYIVAHCNYLPLKK